MKPTHHFKGKVDVRLFQGDCLNVLKAIPSGTIDAFIADGPYGLVPHIDIQDLLAHFLKMKDYNPPLKGFNGNEWDNMVPGPETMREVYRTLKPGGYAAVFCAKKTYDLLCISMRLAGFIIKDQLQWVHSQGTAKTKEAIINGQDVRGDLRAKYEPIVLAQKPMIESSLKDNVERFGAGGLSSKTILGEFYAGDIISDGSPESIKAIQGQLNGVALCPSLLDGDYDSAICVSKPSNKEKRLWLDGCGVGKWDDVQKNSNAFINQNEAAEYNFHPTKKPILLMSYLVRLLTNEGAIVLDSYAGSFTTGVAAALNNRNFIGVDISPAFVEIGKHRIWNALDRRDNPKTDDYKYFCKFIDSEIIKKQELELREKILSRTATFAERLIYSQLISALSDSGKNRAA